MGLLDISSNPEALLGFKELNAICNSFSFRSNSSVLCCALLSSSYMVLGVILFAILESTCVKYSLKRFAI